MGKRTLLHIPAKRKKATKFLKLTGATEHNIKKLDVTIPLGGLVTITGVSGSGKSTLIHKILVPAVKTYLTNTHKTLYSKANYIRNNLLKKINTWQLVIKQKQ